MDPELPIAVDPLPNEILPVRDGQRGERLVLVSPEAVEGEMSRYTPMSVGPSTKPPVNIRTALARFLPALKVHDRTEDLAFAEPRPSTLARRGRQER